MLFVTVQIDKKKKTIRKALNLFILQNIFKHKFWDTKRTPQGVKYRIT